MNNELRDVSIVTMIGQLPSIINYNNDLIEKEFSELSESGKLKIDVSSNNIKAHNGYFDVLYVNGSAFSYDSLATKSQLQTIDNRLTEIASLTPGGISGYSVSSSNSEISEYDMSSFFTTGGKGVVEGISCDELYHSTLYRVIDGVYIPLQVGSSMVNGKIKNIIYHDHIDISGSEKVVQRVYVIVVNDPDNNSVRQYGSASTIDIA